MFLQDTLQLHMEQKRQLVEAHVAMTLQAKRLADARRPMVAQLLSAHGRAWDAAPASVGASLQVCNRSALGLEWPLLLLPADNAGLPSAQCAQLLPASQPTDITHCAQAGPLSTPQCWAAPPSR